MANRLKLAVLISGRGSNMEALVSAAKKPDFPAEITVIVSDNDKAPGLLKAEQYGLSTVTVNRKAYNSRKDFEAALSAALKTCKVDLICLAGFMQILSESFIQQWQGRIINIHPSLLPSYKGLDTHRRVLEAGEEKSGCTVHYVTPGIDEGPVILQKEVTILPDDTPESLAERILAVEHKAYPEAIRKIAKFWPDFITL